MKELLIRALSGVVYMTLLLLTLYNEDFFIGLLYIFGIISLIELNKLIHLKGFAPYVIFTVLFAVFGYWQTLMHTHVGFDEATQILHVLTIFALLLLIKDLFSEKSIPITKSKQYIVTTFYLSSGFIFMGLIADFYTARYNPNILLGAFILVWINDSFAYLVGKNLGKQKLFPSVSPKKTVEGFLGGLFFACIASYFIAQYSKTLTFSNWLILAIIISVFGTLGDLIESKFKRQAKVKDSGVIMPGHGGLLDRLDSIIFAAPFIYLFLRILKYVS